MDATSHQLPFSRPTKTPSQSDHAGKGGRRRRGTHHQDGFRDQWWNLACASLSKMLRVRMPKYHARAAALNTPTVESHSTMLGV